MKSYLLPVAMALALGLSACSSTPRARIDFVPPSTMPVKASVAKARTHADTTSARLTDATAKAKSATENIVKLEGTLADQPVVLVLAKAVHGELDALTQSLLGANTSNDALKTELDVTVAKANGLQVEVDTQTVQLNERGKQLNAALAQSEIDRKHAHTYKGFIIGLAMFAAVAIMFGLFKFAAFVPPLAYVTIAAPAAVGVWLFFWLGSG